MSRELTILGIRFTVEEVEIVNKHDPALGQVDYWENSILIDKNLPVDMKNQTLMHEIIHAVLWLLGYREEAHDEQKVQGLSTALHSLLKSNQVIWFA